MQREKSMYLKALVWIYTGDDKWTRYNAQPCIAAFRQARYAPQYQYVFIMIQVLLNELRLVNIKERLIVERLGHLGYAEGRYRAVMSLVQLDYNLDLG